MKVILNHLSTLPVTYENLKTSNIGKTIKSLTKSTVENIKTPANEIFNRWKEVVTEASVKKKRTNENPKEVQVRKIQKVESESERKATLAASFSSSNAFGSKPGVSHEQQKTITRKKDPSVRTGVMVLEQEDLKPKIIKSNSNYEPNPISIDDIKKDRSNIKKIEKKVKSPNNIIKNIPEIKNESNNIITNNIINNNNNLSPTIETKENDTPTHSPTSGLNTSQTNIKIEPISSPVRRKRVNWDSNLTSVRKIPKVKNNPNYLAINQPPSVMRESTPSKYSRIEKQLAEWRERLNNMPQDPWIDYSSRLKCLSYL